MPVFPRAFPLKDDSVSVSSQGVTALGERPLPGRRTVQRMANELGRRKAPPQGGRSTRNCLPSWRAPRTTSFSAHAGEVAVIPGGVEHEGWCQEDTEVVDIFVPPREDFLGGGTPAYMREK
jgi:hypothetical protein